MATARTLLIALTANIASLLAAAAQAESTDPMNETPEGKAARLAWWKEARFGMFIHWGVYAELAGVYKGEQVDDIGEWIDDYTSDMGKELYRFVRQIQPNLIVNNRVDKGRQGYAGFDREGDFAGDYGTPEQEIPATGVPGLDWEACMTMNDTWGWKANDSNWKSSAALVRNLVDIVSKGGNFLLNVGPTPEGVIPQPSVDRLQEMGDWIRANGDSVYGAHASPFPKPDWGRYTLSDDALYAHLFTIPESRTIQIPFLAESKTYGAPTLLATQKPLTHATTSQRLEITLPESLPETSVTVIRIPRQSPEF